MGKEEEESLEVLQEDLVQKAEVPNSGANNPWNLFVTNTGYTKNETRISLPGWAILQGHLSFGNHDAMIWSCEL